MNQSWADVPVRPPSWWDCRLRERVVCHKRGSDQPLWVWQLYTKGACSEQAWMYHSTGAVTAAGEQDGSLVSEAWQVHNTVTELWWGGRAGEAELRAKVPRLYSANFV